MLAGFTRCCGKASALLAVRFPRISGAVDTSCQKVKDKLNSRFKYLLSVHAVLMLNYAKLKAYVP